MMQAGGSSAGSIHNVAYINPESDTTVKMVDDVGGEWEREGLGRGLEERMESLMTVSGRA